MSHWARSRDTEIRPHSDVIEKHPHILSLSGILQPCLTRLIFLLFFFFSFFSTHCFITHLLLNNSIGFVSLTEATWKELLVPRWSRSWHIQDTNRAKISISLKRRSDSDDCMTPYARCLTVFQMRK